jgi:hypothetical protein
MVTTAGLETGQGPFCTVRTKPYVAPFDGVNVVTAPTVLPNWTGTALPGATAHEYESSMPTYPVDVLPFSVTEGKPPADADLNESHTTPVPGLAVTVAVAIVEQRVSNDTTEIPLWQPSLTVRMTEWAPTTVGVRTSVVVP